jgi:hypothetical protein
MRLINPSTGEISDRLTILALKILAGAEKGTDVAHFETERAALLTAIRTKTLNGKWFEGVLGLGAVNAMLWHAEDDLRILRNLPRGHAVDQDATTIAFRVQALNDRRAELVGQINKEAGDGDSKEKG